MPIILDNPEQYTIPPSEGFIPDRLGVRRFSIDIDRTTGAISASFTPCPANETAWGPRDEAEVTTPDIAAEMMQSEDSPEKLAALQALQQVQQTLQTALPTVAGYLLKLRS